MNMKKMKYTEFVKKVEFYFERYMKEHSSWYRLEKKQKRDKNKKVDYYYFVPSEEGLHDLTHVFYPRIEYETYLRMGDFETQMGTFLLSLNREMNYSLSLRLPTKKELIRHLIPCLIETNGNEAILKNLPHRDMFDFSIIYSYVLDSQAGRQINNCMMEVLGITEDYLYEHAIKNLNTVFPLKMINMRDFRYPNVPKEMLDDVESELVAVSKNASSEMYIVSNDLNYYGGNALINMPFLKQVGEQLNDDFWVLATFVHEVVIIPIHTTELTVEQLMDMVHSARMGVNEEEFLLSQMVYLYSRQDEKLISVSQPVRTN